MANEKDLKKVDEKEKQNVNGGVIYRVKVGRNKYKYYVPGFTEIYNTANEAKQAAFTREESYAFEDCATEEEAWKKATKGITQADADAARQGWYNGGNEPGDKDFYTKRAY